MMLVTGIMALGFSLSIGFLLGFHVYLLSGNRTTIEDHYKNAHHPYNVGFWRNVEAVFGTNRWLWLLPVETTPGDGINFLVSTPSGDVGYANV